MISIAAENSFDRIITPIHDKSTQKTGHFNLVKNIYKNPTAKIIHNDETLNTIPKDQEKT